MSVKVEQVYYNEQLITDENNPDNKYLSGSIEYIVTGAKTEDAAIRATRARVNKKYKGMRLSSISVQERMFDDLWKIVVDYDYQAFDEEDEMGHIRTTYNYNTQMQKITKSIKTIDYESIYKRFLDHDIISKDHFQQSIGVKHNGDIEGVEILVPVFSFEEHHRLDTKELDTAWRKKTLNVIGKVNLTAWRGYEAGELLCAGIGRVDNNDNTSDVTYKFLYRPNEKTTVPFYFQDQKIDLEVDKKGWEYLWMYQVPTASDTNKEGVVIQQVQNQANIAAFLEQVYLRTEYRNLGIGG